MKADKNILRAEPHRYFQRVLVPVVFTLAWLEALRHAAILVERFRSAICLLHVPQPHPFAISENAFPTMKSDDELVHESTEQLSRLAREELPSDQPVTPLVRYKHDPGTEFTLWRETQSAADQLQPEPAI